MNWNVLVGVKFGYLKVIEILGTDKNGNRQVLCKCDCSSNKVLRYSHLKAKSIVSF